MTQRKVELLSSKNTYKDRYALWHKDLGDVMCWRDQNKKCNSQCAAWYLDTQPNVVQCMALPHDAVIARIKNED